MDRSKLARFLQKIKMIESSGGVDLNHPEMQSGIHKGQSAYGSYGLMPNTIQEIVNRSRISGKMNPSYKEIYNKDPETVKTVLEQNPEIEEQLAKDLALRLLQKMPDEDRAAYGWNMGHNLPPERISEEDLNTHPYVNKFKALQKIGAK